MRNGGKEGGQVKLLASDTEDSEFFIKRRGAHIERSREGPGRTCDRLEELHKAWTVLVWTSSNEGCAELRFMRIWVVWARGRVWQVQNIGFAFQGTVVPVCFLESFHRRTEIE